MQRQGGSQYGMSPPEIPFNFSTAGGGRKPKMIGIAGSSDNLQQQHQQPVVEAASPISSRPPPQPMVAALPPAAVFDEFRGGGSCDGGGGALAGSFADEETLGCAAEETERGGGSRNRWPRQETLALLKIRSEMDEAFRNASHKGPLWEDVSRKLAEMGYSRSAKKCKEKFENVHKYYKRTKDCRAGRHDGKSYRFFSQLEALHNSATAAAPETAPAAAAAASAVNTTPTQPAPMTAPAVGPTVISFSSDTFSSSPLASDGEETEDGGCSGGGGGGGGRCGRKRKRGGWRWGGVGRKMTAFFEGLMKQVVERQEAMQQRFLETMEKREKDRMIREEAWKRQEMGRISREYELMAQERATAANRDAALISFLQKLAGTAPPSPAPPPAPPQAVKPGTPLPLHLLTSSEPSSSELPEVHAPAKEGRKLSVLPLHPLTSSEPTSLELQEAMAAELSPVATSSRWPKAEVHALIKLRSGMESKYIESGPKGPLWEEISMGMKKLGFNRNSKRCKEKWENINKYFKKVKESNKKRPEDAKTCPYFQQLDALYRKKQTQPAPAPPCAEQASTNGGDHGPRSNGDLEGFFGESPNDCGSGGLKKTMSTKDDYDKLGEGGDSDMNINHEEDDDYEEDDDDDEEEEGKLLYEIQFQRQAVGEAGGGPGGEKAATLLSF